MEGKETYFETQLRNAMGRLEAAGVKYPDGYYGHLLRKYENFKYPNIIRRIGDPYITKHPRYKEVLKRGGKLLDYGCGTGDDIRALLRDGYPRGDITGFDINWDNINIGFDLYIDMAGGLESLFVVAPEPPFSSGSFDTVYSGSVLHGFTEKDDMAAYLDRIHSMLRKDGNLLGTTLGKTENGVFKAEYAPPNVMSKSKLRFYLERSRFKELDISQDNGPEDQFIRLWFWGEV